MRCRACGAEGQAGQRFCAACGKPFARTAAEAGLASIAAEGERRQLTVLFADVVGATALSGRLDPEVLRDMLREYHLICTACVTRYGGNVNQYLGDGVLALFGYPVAHENDAERAILAGLALVAEMRTLDRSLKAKGVPGIDVRVGIHTGLVVVGEVNLGDSQVSQAIGETPNLAARTQGEAAPNSVCISAATLALVRDRFEVNSMGAKALKGVAAPTELFTVIRAVGSHSSPLRQEAPIIGRDLELQHLVDRWVLAQGGQGQAVFISGEPGIGKSRLLRTFRESITTRSDTWRSLHCSPFYQNSALHPVIDLMERAIDATAPGDRAADLRNLLRSAGMGDEVTFALVGSLLGLVDGNASQLGDLSPDRLRRLTFEALIDWVRADAKSHPLIILVEDLHWIDASTRELLGLLLRRIGDAPVLLILTFRPEFVPPWPAAAHGSSLDLTKLSPQQVGDVVRGMVSGKELPPEVVAEIVLRTDGVPLFVEELTKAVLASGSLVERDGELELARAGELAVPATLRDSLTARLDRLGAAKAIAQLASVLGREFDYAVLQSVSNVPEDELVAQLAGLNREEIIQQSGIAPRSHYVFKHALIQEAAYDTLLKSVRQQHHRRIAQSLVERFNEVAQARPELVAHHYSRGSQPEVAVPYWQRAGELAVQRSGHDEAIAHLRSALEQLEQIPDTPARAAMELAIRVTVGPALSVRTGFGSPETGANYARACELSEVLGESIERFAAMWGDWLYKNTKGQQVAAARRSEDLVALSRKLGDDQYVLQAHHSRWTNFFFLGDAGVARADTLTGIRLYDREGHRHHKHLYGGHDPGVCAHNFGAGAAWVTGHTREALALVDGALSLARELDHGISSVTAHILAPIVLSNAGATAKGQAMAEQMIGLCEKLGVLQFIGGGKVMAGACIALQGDATLGLRLIEEGLTSHRKTTWVVMSPTLLALAAEAHLRVGNTAHALDLLSEARDASQKSDVRWYVPEALRLEAETLLETGQIRADDAIARLRAVVELSRQQGALVFEWRAAATLARVVTQTGRDDQARQDLQTLVAKSAEGRDSPDLEAVKSLLSTLE